MDSFDQSWLSTDNHAALDALEQIESEYLIKKQSQEAFLLPDPSQYLTPGFLADSQDDEGVLPLENIEISDLRHPVWQLPPEIIENYSRQGISNMYPWQVECLSLPGVYEHQRNLLFSAPTSAGKSMIAEVLAFHLSSTTGSKSLFVLPFVSLVTEKVKTLQKLTDGLAFSVTQSHGHLPLPSVTDSDLIICTFEKANAYINKLIDQELLSEIGLVVFDEVHMLTDSKRGFIVKIMIAKLKALAPKTQIVAMSATLPNLDELSMWLDAELYVTDFRPIPLSQFFVVNNSVYDDEWQFVRKVPGTCHPQDPDYVIPLCYEPVSQKQSVLIFCATREQCERCACNIANLMTQSTQSTDDSIMDGRYALIKEFQELTTISDSNLINLLLPSGIAYHHAGLTLEERELIEHGYRIGTILILVATTTLSAGLNLPAQRVILRSPYTGRRFLDPQTFHQMKGRAGRRIYGVPTIPGECFVMCRENERQKVSALVTGAFENLSSGVLKSDEALMRFVMEMCALNVIRLKDDLSETVKSLLFLRTTSCQENHSVIECCNTVLSKLENDLFLKTDGKSFEVLPLGSAMVASSLSALDAQLLHRDLSSSRRNYDMDSLLFSLYQLAPVSNELLPVDWNVFLDMICSWPPEQLDVVEKLDVRGSFIQDCVSGYAASVSLSPFSAHSTLLRRHTRFWYALLSQAYLESNNVTFDTILRRFYKSTKISRGQLQSFLASSLTFSGQVCLFCEAIGWMDLKTILSPIASRLFSASYKTKSSK